MTCAECTTAAASPRWGCYMTGCKDCQARALAHSPQFAASAARQTITPEYRAALALARAEGESELDTHKRVREWDRRITAAPLGRPLGTGEPR